MPNTLAALEADLVHAVGSQLRVGASYRIFQQSNGLFAVWIVAESGSRRVTRKGQPTPEQAVDDAIEVLLRV